MPLLLMGWALAGALRSWRVVPYRLLAVLAWTASLLATPLLLLLTGPPNDPCTANAPVDPLSGSVLPLSLLAALVAGSSAGWIAWVLTRRRAWPVALYTVWLATVAAT
ncbi:hypothetical protein, partial [Streptomyces sp. NPDC020362]